MMQRKFYTFPTSYSLLLLMLSYLLEVAKSASVDVYIATSLKENYYKLSTISADLVTMLSDSPICAGAVTVSNVNSNGLAYQPAMFVVGDASNPFAAFSVAVNGTRSDCFEDFVRANALQQYGFYQNHLRLNYFAELMVGIPLGVIIGGLAVLASARCAFVFFERRKAQQEERRWLLPSSTKDGDKIKEQARDVPLLTR